MNQIHSALLKFSLFTSSLLFSEAIFSKNINAKPNNFSYAPACESVQPQSQLLRLVQEKIESRTQNSQEDTDETLRLFWEKVEKNGTPYIENLDNQYSRVIFLWRGAKHNARLIGGPSHDHEWLTRLKNTDIWFKEFIVDNQFIGSYRYAIDISNLDGYLSHYCPQLDPSKSETRAQRRAILDVQQLDPLNTQTYLDDPNQYPLRNENILKMHHVPEFIEHRQYHFNMPLDLKMKTHSSEILKNQRKVEIYTSQRLDQNQAYITLIFFDGQQYSKLINIPKVLEIMVNQGKLPPVQAIFINHPNELRSQELTPNSKFSQYFSQEFLPWLDQILQHERQSQSTAIIGSSLGGLSATYLALKNPDQISHVIPLSGSFWWQRTTTDLPNGISHMIRNMTKSGESNKKQSWYISANNYETSEHENGLSILNSSPFVAEDLKRAGHDVTYKQYIGGHTYAIWQVSLQEALLHFFADSVTLKTKL